MKFGSTRGQLYDAQKTARARWASAEETWHDDSRREFEDQVWEPMDHLVTNVLRAIDQLSVLFTQVRQECEYHP